MTTAKDAILSRIRAAIPVGVSEEVTQRLYRERESLDLDVFEDRLIDYGVVVYRCSQADVRDTIRTVLRKAAKERLLIPAGFPGDLLPDGFVFERDHGLSYEELDRAGGVLTGCALGVAETGTIFLQHTEMEGRRALTLIPDYHLCVIEVGQIVATLPEGIRLAALFGTPPITTISGPSATSDIEMTRVKGVHGPRMLDVVLVI